MIRADIPDVDWAHERYDLKEKVCAVCGENCDIVPEAICVRRAAYNLCFCSWVCLFDAAENGVLQWEPPDVTEEDEQYWQ